MAGLKTSSMVFVIFFSFWSGYGEASPIKDAVHFKQKVSGKSNLIQGAVVCDGCKFIIGSIKIRFNNTKVQKLLEQKLSKDCLILTSNKTDTCSMLVPIAMEMLKSSMKLSDEQICQDLTLCPVQMKEPGLMNGKYKDGVNGIECSVCKVAVEAIDAYLLTKVDSIYDYVVKVCKNLPGPASQECLDFVASLDLKKTMPLIIKTVLDAKDVCEIAGMCTPPSLPIEGSSL